MYEKLEDVALKTGEKVEAGMVLAPDLQWAERLVKLLYHKGDPANWQNSEVLKSDVGIEVYFYVLHRDGSPFSNILTAEFSGVGILGHVWTNPEDRRKGACSSLMKIQMEHFRSRGGKALFLGTGFDTHPYYIYEGFGFRGIEDKSGYMDYYSTSKKEFEADYFAKEETDIQTLGWTHWPSSPALFLGDFPGIVRCAPMRLIGRASTENPFLPAIRDGIKREEEGEKPNAMVLRNRRTTAVVGFTMWRWHPIWPDTCLLDIYCHPAYWDKAGDLLASLSLPDADRYIAYGDASCEQKYGVLSDAGFRQTARFVDRVPGDKAKTFFVGVTLFER